MVLAAMLTVLILAPVSASMEGAPGVPSEPWPCQAMRSDSPCIGIRPGALFHSKDWTDCTGGFMFRGDGAVYQATAGHCVLDVGDPVWYYSPSSDLATTNYSEMEARPPDAIVVFRPEEFAMDRRQPETDLALLRINAHAAPYIFPDVCVWAGPLGIFSGDGTRFDETRYYGHGVGFHGTMEARTGIGINWTGDAVFHTTGPAEVGDSGAPVLDVDGFAIGHLTHLNIGTPSGARGTLVGMHVSAVIREAAGAGIALELLVAGSDPLAAYEGEPEHVASTTSDPSNETRPQQPVNRSEERTPVPGESSSPFELQEPHEVPVAAFAAMTVALLVCAWLHPHRRGD